MYLKHLSLTNFRKFTRLAIDLPPRVVLLAGANAQGKTSVLEAIYFLAAFTSFQTHADRQIVNFDEARSNQLTVTRLVAEYQRSRSKHRLEVRLILEPVGVLNSHRLRKEILLDGVKRPVNEVIGHFNAVIFVPQMSQIVEGAPEDRRRYLNLALAQSTPAYARILSEYNQALTQRNALLKMLAERGGSSDRRSMPQSGNVDQLDVWDEALARLGAQLILWRIEAIQQIERLASRVHHELTRGSEILRISYEPAFDPLPRPNGQLGLRMDMVLDRSRLELNEIRDGFLANLSALRSMEIARGSTTIGPHRDEIRFLANDIDLGYYGSRGQVRTALLSLKLAEVNWMKDRTGEWPVILLDEVMAELDPRRRSDLMKYMSETEQVLFTTADLRAFTAEFADKVDVWQVEDGKVEKTAR